MEEEARAEGVGEEGCHTLEGGAERGGELEELG